MIHERRRRLLVFPSSRCTCGLSWPCPDAIAWPVGSPIPDGATRHPTPLGLSNRPRWDGPTRMVMGYNAAPQAGRAGRLTRGQAFRANGKHAA